MQTAGCELHSTDPEYAHCTRQGVGLHRIGREVACGEKEARDIPRENKAQVNRREALKCSHSEDFHGTMIMEDLVLGPTKMPIQRIDRVPVACITCDKVRALAYIPKGVMVNSQGETASVRCHLMWCAEGPTAKWSKSQLCARNRAINSSTVPVHAHERA